MTMAVVVVGRRLKRVWLPLAIALATLSVVWVVGYALAESGWNDVDGWADCSDCGWWHVVGAFFFLGPPVIGVVVVIGVLVTAVVGRVTGRQRSASGCS
jgi:hypothetical protein